MEQQGAPAQGNEIKAFPMESSRPRPILAHFAVLTAFLVPITLLSYLVTRKQLSMFRRELDDTRLTAALQRDTKKLLAIGAERDKCIRTVIDKVKRDVEVLRLEAERRHSARVTSDNIVRSDLQQLLSERHHARAQVMALRELGSSLADVAAFMHEVELKEGLKTKGEDGRGIDRLRLLALRMRDLPD